MMRTCLLTGASGYLGAAFIARFHNRYRIVAVHNERPIQSPTQDQSFVDPLEPTREFPENEHPVYAISRDLGQPRQIASLIDEVAERVEQVDLVINAAACRHWAPLLAPHGLDGAQEAMDVNVLAPMRLAVGLARRLWAADPDANLRANRNIVNVSSSAGLFIYPDLGQSVYAASKAALNHLTYHLASEFWHIGVRVNAVAPDTFPGRVETSRVLDEILSLDVSDRTGQVIEVLPR
jgi:NAD(P)-dependent dehydrogenase (short-subunit alcohol dehydrogenase family)